MRSTLKKAVLALAIVVGVLHVGPSAHAAFPGINGLIAYVQAGNVFVVNPANPVPTQVTNTGNFTRAKFNATGSKLVADQTAGLVLLDPIAGSAVTPVPNTTGTDTRPTFDPTGTKIAFNNGTTLTTIEASGANRTNILNTAGASRPDWSPDGTFIAYDLDNGTQIRRVSPTGANLTILATRGPGNVLCGGANACFTPSVSPDNLLVAYGQRGAANGLAEVNANGTTVTPKRLSTGGADVVSYSPDGKELTFRSFPQLRLQRVPSDGSGTITQVSNIANITWTNWGVGAAQQTPTDPTMSIAGSAKATRSNSVCSFPLSVSPAGAASATVTYSGDVGNIVNGPTSATVDADGSSTLEVDVKNSKKKSQITATLSNPQGAALGSAAATCDIAKKKR